MFGWWGIEVQFLVVIFFLVRGGTIVADTVDQVRYAEEDSEVCPAKIILSKTHRKFQFFGRLNIRPG